MPSSGPSPRSIPSRMEDRLIVALDLPSVAEARAIVARLDGTVSFFKLGLWLIFAPGFEALLDDLLAAARADIVRRNIDWQPVDVSEITLEVCEHLRAKAEIKQQVLRSHVCPSAWTRGDVSMLRRLLNILLDNAIKYTPELGMIDVSLERANARLELKVRDSGIGIPPDALSRIFDRFYKVDESRNREDGSSEMDVSRW